MEDPTEALNERFAPNGKLSPDVLATLLSILRLHSLSAEELFFKWESYVIKMGIQDAHISDKISRDFKKDLQDQLERESRAKAGGGHQVHQSRSKTAATPRAGVNGSGSDVFGMIDGMMGGATPARLSAGSAKRKNNFETPAAKSARSNLNSSPSQTPSTVSSTSFMKRSNAGQAMESLNDHLPSATAPAEPATGPRIKLTANADMKKFAYRPMALKLSESSEILDERIDLFTELVQKHHQLPDNAFGNPAAQSSSEIVCVGRIACDLPNGQLTSATVVLETSRRMGAGLRVPLGLDNLTRGIDFFPGRIVALKGSNVSGETFVVNDILPIPILPAAASTPAELAVHNDRLTSTDGSETRPLSVTLASGPYTTDTDLDFSPLYTLLDRAQEDHTDVLILTGPFLDLNHPLIASGDLEPYLPSDAKIEPDRATLNDVFRILISQPLQRLAKAVPSITILLVPSVRDAVSKHVSWPQDRLPKALLGLPKQAQVVTNPITLSVNELVFGITSQDVLSELMVGFFRGPNPVSVSDILANHTASIIEQRHFFPVFPPQAPDALPKPTAIAGEVRAPGQVERQATGACLDLAYLKLGEWFHIRPDVLITPSRLTPFVKVVESVLCINPGTLSKKRGAGTFASMAVQPRVLSDEEREAEAPVVHNVFDRARVDVVRI